MAKLFLNCFEYQVVVTYLQNVQSMQRKVPVHLINSLGVVAWNRVAYVVSMIILNYPRNQSKIK